MGIHQLTFQKQVHCSLSRTKSASAKKGDKKGFLHFKYKYLKIQKLSYGGGI
jgi:hypothetical protein